MVVNAWKKEEKNDNYVANLDQLEMTTKLSSFKKIYIKKRILTNNVLLAALFSMVFSSSEIMLTARKSYQKYKKNLPVGPSAE